MACIVIWYQTALKFLGESPLSANLIHNLGTLFYAEKHYQRARVCFKRALLCRADLHEAQDSLDTANSFVRTQCSASGQGLGQPSHKHSMVVTHALQVLDRWHFAMLNDGVRNRKYRLAITAAVTRALEAHGRCTVLDIGTGSGILAMSVT